MWTVLLGWCLSHFALAFKHAEPIRMAPDTRKAIGCIFASRSGELLVAKTFCSARNTVAYYLSYIVYDALRAILNSTTLLVP